MSLNRKSDSDRIVEILSYLKSQVELYSPNNFTDVNIYAENFYRDLLNLIYGFNLKNINILEKNAAAIDLGDSESSIAIQVTSTSDLAKAKQTVKKFNDKGLHKTYAELKILNIKTKKKHRTRKVGDENKFVLDTLTDIWDLSDLIATISDKSTLEISEIRGFLESEITFPQSETVPSEILTFQSLIQLLSVETHFGAGTGFIEEPDPEGKIEKRFSSHETYLKSEFKELYSEYGEILADVRDHSDLGAVRVRRLRLHLKQFSDEELAKCEGDPQKALEKLIDHFQEKLSKSGRAFDLSAIRFYLIDELIRCNVFPNKEKINA